MASPVTTGRVDFEGPQGQRLAGRLDAPAGPPRAFALFAHCFTCSKDSKAAVAIAQALAAAGFAVLRFDFTGLGMSEGDFADASFSANVDDLVAAADFLRRDHRPPALLVGHSLGGTAMLAAAARIPEARAVVTVGSPFEAAHVAHLLQGGEAELRASGEAEVDIGGRRFRLKRGFLDDLQAHDPQAVVPALGRALLVLHAPQDRIVGVDNAARIFTAAKHPKSFVSLDTADHLLTRREDAAYAATVIAAWAERYVPDERPPAPAPVEGRVLVQETGEGRFANHVVIGRHHLLADEPTAVGGLDSGAAPYDLLAAALGACTSMTLRMYAEHKRLPLERVSVQVRHDKIHARDCETCETREGKVDRFERRIALRGELDAAARQRLLEIADRCPVHRTLESEIQVVTTLD